VGCDAEVIRTSNKGTWPQFCPQHRKVSTHEQGNRTHIAKREARKGGDAAAELAERVGISLEGYGKPSETALLERYAVLLGIVQDARKAAELAGVAAKGAELDDWTKRAREEHPELIEGRQTAATSLANGALLLLLLRLRDIAPTLPPAQTASALKQVGDVLDRLQGGMQPVYSEVRVSLALPDVAAIVDGDSK